MSLSPSQILDIMSNSEWWLRARLATPELATVQVVAMDLLPPAYQSDAAWGWTAPGLDMVLGGRVEDRHPTIVVNVASIADVEEDQLDASYRLHALLLHEAAHVVTDLPMYTVPLNPEYVELFRQEITGGVQKIQRIGAPSNERLPFHDHGLRFIRAACHLHFRCRHFVPPVNDVLWGRSLSEMESYATALGNEPQEMRDAAFADILAKPAPSEFWRLWMHDLCPWIDAIGRDLSEGQFQRLLVEMKEAATMAPSK